MTKQETIHQQSTMTTSSKVLTSRASKEKVKVKSYNATITSRRIRDRAEYDNYLKLKNEAPTAPRVLKLTEYYHRTYFNERTGKRTDLNNINQLSLPATVDPPANNTPPTNGSNYQPVSIIYRRLIFEDNNVIDEASALSALSASEEEEIDNEGEANKQELQAPITNERQMLRDRLEKENDLAHFVSGTYDDRPVGIALPYNGNITDVDDYMLNAYEELKDIAEFDCRNKTSIFYYMEGFKRSLRSDKREKLLSLAPEGLLMFVVVLKEMCIRLLEQGEQHVVHRLRTYKSINYARQFALDRPYQREELNLMRAFKRYPDIFSDDSDMADYVKGMIRGDKYVRHILDIEERIHSFWLTC